MPWLPPQELSIMTFVDQFFRDSLVVSLTTYVLAVLVIIVAIAWLARLIWQVHLEYRGTRTVTCPETEDYAGVNVDSWLAAITWIFGRTKLRVQDCSRWPERRNCSQACASQLARRRSN